MTYKFLEHTADVKFLAEGKTLEEAFIESAMALKETITVDVKVFPQIDKKIHISGKDLESLLYNFLEEFLFLLDSEDFLLGEIKEIKINHKTLVLDAVISGDKAEKYHFTNDVKAITYNEMKIEFDETKKEWTCQVVLDV